jgi:hypothetical protein
MATAAADQALLLATFYELTIGWHEAQSFYWSLPSAHPAEAAAFAAMQFGRNAAESCWMRLDDPRPDINDEVAFDNDSGSETETEDEGGAWDAFIAANQDAIDSAAEAAHINARILSDDDEPDSDTY